jgi:hypothetical protein
MNSNVEKNLISDSQLAVAKIVAALPDESVSMVWRSNLNEALRETAAKSRKRRLMLNFLSPVAGLSAACALAFVVFVKPSPSLPKVAPSPVRSQIADSSSLEAGLLRLHQDDVRLSDVVGSGLNPTEVSVKSQPDAPTSDEGDEEILL